MTADLDQTPEPSMYGSRIVAVALAFVLLATLDAAAYTYGGSPWGVVVLLASIVAFAAWILTTLRRPRSAPAAFPLYIGALTAMVVLEAEQWHRRMPSRLMELYPNAFPPGVGITEHAFIAIFPLAASAVFVLGALTYYHGSAFGRFAAWLVFAWGLTASLSVYVFPLLADQPFSYMGGMVSAPLLLLVSVAGMRRLLRAEGRADETPNTPGRRASDVTSRGATSGGVAR